LYVYCTYWYVLGKVMALDIKYSATCCHMNTLQFVHATCSCLSQGPHILQSYRNTNSAVSAVYCEVRSQVVLYTDSDLQWRKARNLSSRVPAWVSPCWICGWRSGWHWSRLLSENFGFFVCILPPIFVFTATLDCRTNGESLDTPTLQCCFGKLVALMNIFLSFLTFKGQINVVTGCANC